MDWYRMKTILIFLFLGINLFLAALLGYESYAEHRSAKAQTESTIATLGRSGITVSAQTPIGGKRLRSLTLENPCADKAAFTALLLGEGTESAGDHYQKDGKSLRFTENGFSYIGTSSPVPCEKKHISSMKKVLENMGFSMRYAKGTIENGAVVFTQIVDKVPLFGSSLRVTPASDGSVSKIEGTWANVLDAVGEKSRTSGAAKALLAFLQEGTHQGKTITDIQCGYAVLFSGDGYRTADAVPTWRIETADGSTAFYDARQ